MLSSDNVTYRRIARQLNPKLGRASGDHVMPGQLEHRRRSALAIDWADSTAGAGSASASSQNLGGSQFSHQSLGVESKHVPGALPMTLGNYILILMCWWYSSLDLLGFR
ncbi:hypothetical protein F5Y00DRAFT_262595 [Daldinia vernicosa]|uniref:uncharacterized protein n=1 Tax=Daldinia vernicosa TaxID=114800 RepID=UPI0020089FAA|nr:uncharacterized protein F5Y00DRAFT_262595 [Daldinia vernicosa]KAI0848499.1 hypothetical protein F5Y00DRAFT_262595 [Daldinia vernicosa]